MIRSKRPKKSVSKLTTVGNKGENSASCSLPLPVNEFLREELITNIIQHRSEGITSSLLQVWGKPCPMVWIIFQPNSRPRLTALGWWHHVDSHRHLHCLSSELTENSREASETKERKNIRTTQFVSCVAFTVLCISVFRGNMRKRDWWVDFCSPCCNRKV